MILRFHLLRFIVPLTVTVCSTGCSWESVQRTGYETVESMRLQQCMDQQDADCPEGRTSYDDYQSEKERLVGPKP